MAYDGWIEYGGVELINLSRTAQLAQRMGIDVLWTEPASVAWIQSALFGVDYHLITNAPWYDAGHPASAEFAGIVPLSIPMLDDSTMEATTIEYITDGGSSGKRRNKTLPIVANVAVLASTERGADYGKRWLDRMLRGSKDQTFCSGSELRYFQNKQGEDLPVPQQLHRRDVSITRGTTVGRKRSSYCSATWIATFTWTANDPFEYADERAQFTGLGGAVEAPDMTVATNLNPDPRRGTAQPNNVQWTVTPDVAIADHPLGHSVGLENRLANGETSVSALASLFNVDGLGDSLTARWTGTWLKANVNATAQMYHSGGGVNVSAALPANQWVWLATSSAQKGYLILSVTVQGRYAVPTDRLWIGGTIASVSPITGYFDGDTLDEAGVVYSWTGAANNSTSTKGVSEILSGSGSLTMIEQSCAIYDYTPIYDPLYPALVPSPVAPDFYPDGWDFGPGKSFLRHWVTLFPIEPSALNVVPVVTLTTNVAARMVRVSIWPADAEIDSFCEPLWTVTVSYIPTGMDFVIDGEQQAAYAWDRVSPAVRRTDSLIYGTNARPIEWTAFNNPDGLRVTLDLTLDDTTGEWAGEDSVRAALSLVPKSD